MVYFGSCLQSNLIGFIFINPSDFSLFFVLLSTRKTLQQKQKQQPQPSCFREGRKSKTANKIRPEERESVMLEIYVLKLCVVSFEGTLPCRVENALISKRARRRFVRSRSHGGGVSPEGPGTVQSEPRWRVADQTWASTARTAPPQSSLAAFVPLQI